MCAKSKASVAQFVNTRCILRLFRSYGVGLIFLCLALASDSQEFVELSDRKIIEWAEKSGLQKPKASPRIPMFHLGTWGNSGAG
eukprot:4698141-Amphidinium_carterae.3